MRRPLDLQLLATPRNIIINESVWTASRRSTALRREQAHRRCLLFVSHKVADYGQDSQGFTWPHCTLVFNALHLLSLPIT